MALSYKRRFVGSNHQGGPMLAQGSYTREYLLPSISVGSTVRGQRRRIFCPTGGISDFAATFARSPVSY